MVMRLIIVIYNIVTTESIKIISSAQFPCLEIPDFTSKKNIFWSYYPIDLFYIKIRKLKIIINCTVTRGLCCFSQ